MADILAWLNPTRWLVIIAAAGALVLGYHVWQDHQQGIGEDRANARWRKATDKLKADAKDTLATETAKARAAEQALQDFKNQREIKDAHNKTTVDSLATRLRELAGASGRLRDPNATAGCWRGGDSATGQTAAAAGDRPGDGAQAGGLLSVELSGLLRARIEEADTINIAYASCRADAFEMRASQP
jgi:hypothetical protein